MRIDLICNDGSPLSVTEKSLRGEDGRLGVGGAELALLTMCGAWHKAGYDVVLYNNPKEMGASYFEQRNLDDFHPEDNRDVLVIFRSPNERSYSAKGLKVWWSCDQVTMGDYKQFATTVDKIVTISPFHARYFREMYGITDTVSIDLPVRSWEYQQKIEKVKHRCIFTSVPDRGLISMRAIWPNIVEQVPDASLVITSDWRLWSEYADESLIREYRLMFSGMPNVEYMGAVKRCRLVEEQLKSDLHLYSGVYDELFCIAVAESQVAKSFPITSNYGALPTTNMGMVISGNPLDASWRKIFVEKAVELLNDPKLEEKQNHLHELAIKRFSIDRVLKLWDTEVFGNG